LMLISNLQMGELDLEGSKVGRNSVAVRLA
jgi:hypothetical protein